METYSLAETIRELNAKEIPLFSLNELGGILNIANRQTLYKKISRLEKKQILKKLTKGKYLYLLKKTNDFTLANFLYQPSYISLQSALSFYSIITGFAYQITSLTTRKSKNIVIDGKTFSYSALTPKLFWGYESRENFLIARPEKALLDYIYFAAKGLAKLDWEEIDITRLDKKILLTWARKFNSKVLNEIRNKI